MASDPKRVQAVFLLAAESPPDDRPALLDRECGGDGELRHAVESLLRAHDRSGSFLDRPVDPHVTRPAAGDAPADPPPADLDVGGRVGSYKLLQKLGEGGMGAVWAAEQDRPVRRRVAVKLIKPGMDSAQVLRRFDAERQALALMDHPNIAAILDAGVEAARGCPYFVMELVKGVPITAYCDELHLSVRERLGLFVPVCRAVQHAHHKGIVHRDLKPSNVLVCVRDGRPVPKVIDFGVAKALHRPLTDGSVYTAIGAVVGTLQYMAPEQAELSPLDVDTRADVYGLGVLLYELLTGTTPLDPERLQRAALAETLRVIREEEPPRPSTRLADSKEALAGLAAMRRTEPARLTREVSGDLDWIAMKALEKDRTRRYDTANGLARDVERFLTDEPVEARPPSAGYRVRKFVRRNRRGVVAAGAVLAALVLGVVGTTAGLVWAVREKDAKEQARQDAVAKEKQATEAAARAERRLGELDKSNDILGSIFSNLSPREAKKEDQSLRGILGERLDRAAAQLDAEAVGDPLAVAKLQTRLGISLTTLGYPDKAIPLLGKALRGRETELGRDDPLTLETAEFLARAYLEADRPADALPLAKDTLKRRTARLGPAAADTLATMNTVAGAYQMQRQLAAALEIRQQAWQLAQEHLAATDAYSINLMGNLAGLYEEMKQPDKARPLFEKAVKLLTEVRGPVHPDTLATRMNLAYSYQKANQFPEAIALLLDTLKLQQTHLSHDHPDTLFTLHSLAWAYRGANRTDDAEAKFKEVIRLRKIRLGPTHADTRLSMSNLADLYETLGRLREAIPLFEEVLQLTVEKHGLTHAATLQAKGFLGRALITDRQPAKGLPLMREYLDDQRRELGPHSTRFAGMLVQTSLNLLRSDLYPEAEVALRESLAIREKTEAELPSTDYTRSLLGRSLLGQRRFTEAEPLLVQGYEGMKQRKNKIGANFKWRLPEAADAVIRLYVEWGHKPNEVAEWRAKRAEYPPERLPSPRPAR